MTRQEIEEIEELLKDGHFERRPAEAEEAVQRLLVALKESWSLNKRWATFSEGEFAAGLERAASAAEAEADDLSDSPGASMAEAITGAHCLRELAKTIRELKKEPPT